MDGKKVREAIEFLQRQICTIDAQKEYDEYCNPTYNETLDLAIVLYETAIEALEKQLPKNDLISRNELVSRLNNSATRYLGGKYNGKEYPDIETFDVDEVYEIIDRVWERIPEDKGDID